MNKALVFALGLAITPALAGDFDKRQVLVLTEPQRAHVLEEMRALLAGTQNILSALARDDMATVAHHARPLGMGMAHTAEDHLRGVLPREFMQLGMSVHQDFDSIAADAESLKDPRHTLRQLSESMNKCNGCHANYQVRVSEQPVNAGESHSHHEH